MKHYHIHWSTKDTLDWESFRSRTEAEQAARQLMLTGETYTIEERDETCPQCRAAFKAISDSGAQCPAMQKSKRLEPQTKRRTLFKEISAHAIAV
jgi:hypothetical protein